MAVTFQNWNKNDLKKKNPKQTKNTVDLILAK